MEPIDVNIYILNLEDGKEPKIEKIPGQIIEDVDGYYPLIYHVGPNDFKIFESDFDVDDIDVVTLPFPNTIEVVARRGTPDKFVLEKIARFCKQKLNRIHKEMDMFESALGLTVNELTQIYKEENSDGQDV